MSSLQDNPFVYQEQFSGRGDDFSAYGDARHWLILRGYAVAAIEIGEKSLVFHGPRIVGKYSTLSEAQKCQAVGCIKGNFRSGPVFVVLTGADAVAALDAYLQGLVKFFVASPVNEAARTGVSPPARA